VTYIFERINHGFASRTFP